MFIATLIARLICGVILLALAVVAAAAIVDTWRHVRRRPRRRAGRGDETAQFERVLAALASDVRTGGRF